MSRYAPFRPCLSCSLPHTPGTACLSLPCRALLELAAPSPIPRLLLSLLVRRSRTSACLRQLPPSLPYSMQVKGAAPSASAEGACRG